MDEQTALAHPDRPGFHGEHPVVSAGSIWIDHARYQAYVDGSRLKLTYQEFELLHLLVSNLDHVLSYDDIVRGVWSGSSSGTRRRLSVLICRLRAKLGSPHPYQIQTVRGRGYGLTAESEYYWP